jgi:hypothetical protein
MISPMFSSAARRNGCNTWSAARLSDSTVRLSSRSAKYWYSSSESGIMLAGRAGGMIEIGSSTRSAMSSMERETGMSGSQVLA